MVKFRRKKAGTEPPRRRRWPLIVAGGFVLLFLLGGASFVGASVLEDHDTFCIACHTVPETTYFTRATTAVSSTTAAIPDLATMHYHMVQQTNGSFACINCHRGDASLSERVQTLALGGRDAVIFVAGKSDPTIEKTDIYEPGLPNDACIGCHMDTLLTENGIQTHFHNWLPQTAALVASGKQMVSNGSQRNRRLRTIQTSLTCTSCHLAHKTVTNPDPKLKYVDPVVAQQACDTCHRTAGERPESIDRLMNGED